MNKKKLGSKTRYWIVVGHKAAKKPFRHTTKPEAIKEAERLATVNPNKVFHVCLAELAFVYKPQATSSVLVSESDIHTTVGYAMTGWRDNETIRNSSKTL